MSSRGWTITAYLALVVLLIVVEVLARAGSGRWLSLGETVRRAIRHRPAQLGLVVAWWWIGWHFFGG